jgi:hypothetical protein
MRASASRRRRTSRATARDSGRCSETASPPTWR